MGFGTPLTDFSANAAAAETTLLPPYNSVAINSVAMKSDSGITYNLPIQRKRGRDHSSTNINNQFASYPPPGHFRKNCGCDNNFNFLGEDLSIQIQQQEFDLDLDRLISQHMEKVRVEVEEKQKRNAKRIVEAIELGMIKILRSKEEEMEKMGKLNWELEERVHSLCVENQVWRDVARTNEATANALRSNLEQVLSVQLMKNECGGSGADDDEAESCCGGNYEDQEEDRKRRREEDRQCKNCWKEESCVLLLPCRHLCLCTVCGSSLQTCPICNSINNASVRVIMPYP